MDISNHNIRICALGHIYNSTFNDNFPRCVDPYFHIGNYYFPCGEPSDRLIFPVVNFNLELHYVFVPFEPIGGLFEKLIDDTRLFTKFHGIVDWCRKRKFWNLVVFSSCGHGWDGSQELLLEFGSAAFESSCSNPFDDGQLIENRNSSYPTKLANDRDFFDVQTLKIIDAHNSYYVTDRDNFSKLFNFFRDTSNCTIDAIFRADEHVAPIEMGRILTSTRRLTMSQMIKCDGCGSYRPRKKR